MRIEQLTTEGKEPLLTIRGVSKSFGGIQALQNVDMNVYNKEIVALLGDNGAGKSTLIKIISGVYTPDKGEIRFEGQKVNISNPEEAKRLGIKTVHQDLALFGNLDVTSNLFIGEELTKGGLLQKRKMRRAAKKKLENLGIVIKSLQQKVHSLSGGQQHAVAIARGAYIGPKPKLIIMDEPSAGVGVEESKKMLALLKKLGRHAAVIFITHNLNYAFEVAERAIILHRGQVAGKVRLSQSSHDEIVKLIMGDKS